MYIWPTPNCKTLSKHKYEIVKHLKSCYEISKKKKSLADNKVCDVSKKTFAKIDMIDIFANFMALDSRSVMKFLMKLLPTMMN